MTGVLQAVPTNAAPTAALRTFRAVAIGAFSTDGAPTVTLDPGTPVPEPVVWGLMVIGFGMLGAQRRRMRSAVTAA